MRIHAPLVALAVCAPLAGCGQAPPVIPGAKNNGAMSPLPDGKGFFEVRVDGAGGRGAPARRGKAEPRKIVVYFYGPDGSTAMEPAPTDVAIKLGGDRVVALAPGPDAGSFASKTDDYPADFRGTLAAKIGGEPVEAQAFVR